jgi:hypothetical protein
VSRRGRAGGAALLLLVGAASACRFERRTDLVEDEPVLAALYRAPDHPTTPFEDSVRAAVIAVSDALGASDSAAVVRLTTPDAVLIDQDEAIRWTRVGGTLPRSLAHDASLSWRIQATSFGPIGSDGALYSVLLEAAPPEAEPRSAVESWVVVRTDAAWRVRYLHRSRGSSAPLL